MGPRLRNPRARHTADCRPCLPQPAGCPRRRRTVRLLRRQLWLSKRVPGQQRPRQLGRSEPGARANPPAILALALIHQQALGLPHLFWGGHRAPSSAFCLTEALASCARVSAHDPRAPVIPPLQPLFCGLRAPGALCVPCGRLPTSPSSAQSAASPLSAVGSHPFSRGSSSRGAPHA